MNSAMQWNDLRLILAVAAEGSLSAAGRRLGVSHATVFRRLGRVEEQLGVKMFERSNAGYVPTSAGEEIAAVARRVEAEIVGVERRVAGRDVRPSGTVRVTTTDTLLEGVLSPQFATFRNIYPDISIEVAISNEVLNLSRREADVALRPCSVPPDALAGERLGIIAQAVYGHERLVSSDRTAPSLAAFDWIGPGERMPYPALAKWMRAHGLDDRCRYRFDTIQGMYIAARNAAGLAVLPCYLGDDTRDLVRLSEPLPEVATDLWLLSHADMRRSVRIRTFLQFMGDAIGRQRARLAGEGRVAIGDVGLSRAV